MSIYSKVNPGKLIDCFSVEKKEDSSKIPQDMYDFATWFMYRKAPTNCFQYDKGLVCYHRDNIDRIKINIVEEEEYADT